MHLWQSKYLKMLSVRINISKTNEHFFLIFYICIYYNPPIHESCEVSSGSNSKWPDYHHFCLLKLTKYMKMLSVGWISRTPMNISSWFSTHELTTILWSFVRIKFIMDDLSPFLFAQIDKIFENVVRPNEYLQHKWIFVSDNLHTHLPQSSHESL